MLDKTPAFDLEPFLYESNWIEGIIGVRPMEIEAAQHFLSRPYLNIDDVTEYVRVATGIFAPLRERIGMNVAVGGHIAPFGGRDVARRLTEIIAGANEREPAYVTHHEYEALHPYMDGNGRSGRLIWLWQQMLDGKAPQRSFLHEWYYASLANYRTTARRSWVA